MAAYRIPLDSEAPNFQQRTALDGREYILFVDYNEREDRFYLSIQNTNGEWLIQGRKMVTDVDLIRASGDSRLPPGVLAMVDSKDQSRDPFYGELDKDFVMFYFDGSEFA